MERVGKLSCQLDLNHSLFYDRTSILLIPFSLVVRATRSIRFLLVPALSGPLPEVALHL